MEENLVTLQVDFRHVKNATDPRKRIIDCTNSINDGRLICDFTSFLSVFWSYQGDDRVIHIRAMIG